MARNYATARLGAVIADATQSSAGPSSNPRGLLTWQPGRDSIWEPGDAPQHVTVRLDDNHAPIQFVGWHVNDESSSNPREVEVTSSWTLEGEPSAVGSPLSRFVKLCIAQPGAGTQVWQLDIPIPSSHRYVRFAVLSTFGGLAPYMNGLFLYDTHPDGGSSGVADVHREVVPLNSSSTRVGHHDSGASYYQYQHQVNTSVSLARSGAATPSNIGPDQSSHRSVYSANGSSMLLQSPSLERSSSAANRHGGASHYQHQNPPPPPPPPRGQTDSHTAYRSRSGSGASHGPHYSAASVRVFESEGPALSNNNNNAVRHQRSRSSQMTDLLQGLDEDIQQLRPIHTISPSKGLRRSLSFGGTASGQYPALVQGALHDIEHMAHAASSAATAPLPHSPPRRPLESPPRSRGPSGESMGLDGTVLRSAVGRIDALEQAVEGLTRAVSTQSQDLRDIRELLLSMQKQGAPSSPPAATQPPQSGSGGTQLIEFPEAALRGYIEDVLAPRLSKHAKRVEAKTLQRMDTHLHILLKEIGAVVDERVDRHLARLTHHSVLPLPASGGTPSYSDPHNSKPPLRGSASNSPSRQYYHHSTNTTNHTDFNNRNNSKGPRYGSAPVEGLINSRLGTPSFGLPAEVVPRRPSIRHGSAVGTNSFLDASRDENSQTDDDDNNSHRYRNRHGY